MMIYEDLTVGLIIVLAAATTVAIYLGLLGMVGQVYFVRCASCHHMTSCTVDATPRSCPRCRHHGVLFHPSRAVLHGR